ncbi:hypothetical protein NQ318_002421 [Aromia moschata]|uniref:Putative inositol monophosphatase 3 n=1 Tax=Aromia moschata TaxID=1265417 RepID=A0AAV8YG20_9CUCU|nr:hypothetical protein NQ318_002421 [Aromia moschata]
MILGGSIHLNKKVILSFVTVLFILFMYVHKMDVVKEQEPRKIDLFKLLKVAIRAAENGGKNIVRVKDHINIHSKGLTKEGQQDSVTTADFLSHCSMTNTLQHFFPYIKLISEEAKTKCEEGHIDNYSVGELFIENLTYQYVEEDDVTVWIDPLDATQEYTEKLYDYVTTMVCIAVNGKPLIGVIHKPFNGTTSWAWVDQAMSRDLALDFHENEKQKNNGLKIIVSRSHSGKIGEVLKKNFNRPFEIISAAGAGFKTLELVTRKVDAYLHITAIKKWDICAGNAIVNALGGRMTTKSNQEINYAYTDDVVNDNGLITTMKDHNLFLGIL